ncbi:unnamed protein product [Albugo candida]|nr:unnamed protein product [Albugo candida]|eukprot:CCI47530.1 unnamed protein product [Albugo candida]
MSLSSSLDRSILTPISNVPHQLSSHAHFSDSSSPTTSMISDRFNKRHKGQLYMDDHRLDEFEDPKAKRRAQIAKAARKHRQRQKNELIALRAKVKDLKEQIEVLQSSEPSEYNTELAWKKEAEQHANVRAQVDQENDFLRRTLTEQMKFIQRLQEYFTKQPLLNIPSLDMILNAPSSTSTSPRSLPAAIRSPSSTQSQLYPIRSTLLQHVEKGIEEVDAQIQQCNASFRSPKNPTMAYFGLEVQYETSKDEMDIFFRHRFINFDSKKVMDHIWANFGNMEFEGKYPFTKSVQVLEQLDADTKYIRRVVNLIINDSSSSHRAIKEERLSVQHKRIYPDKSVFISRSILHDASQNKPINHVRRNQNTTVLVKDYKDASSAGCLLLWSTRVILDKNPMDAETEIANLPDVVLKNLFETIPVLVKGIVDRTQS